MKRSGPALDIDAIREALLHGRSASLRRRRWLVGLSAVGMVDFAIISLYQTGIVPRLPDLPGRVFDSNQVSASRPAYVMAHPDATSGATLYGLIAMLATFGGDRATGRGRIWDWLTAGATAAAFGGAAKYLYEMITKEHRACVYCLVGAGINTALVTIALRELHATRE